MHIRNRIDRKTLCLDAEPGNKIAGGAVLSSWRPGAGADVEGAVTKPARFYHGGKLAL